MDFLGNNGSCVALPKMFNKRYNSVAVVDNELSIVFGNGRSEYADLL